MRRCDIHAWRPVPLECGLYACECGATGRRNLETGKIKAHKTPLVLETAATVVQLGTSFEAHVHQGDGAIRSMQSSGYRVRPLPGAR